MDTLEVSGSFGSGPLSVIPFCHRIPITHGATSTTPSTREVAYERQEIDNKEETCSAKTPLYIYEEVAHTRPGPLPVRLSLGLDPTPTGAQDPLASRASPAEPARAAPPRAWSLARWCGRWSAPAGPRWAGHMDVRMVPAAKAQARTVVSP